MYQCKGLKTAPYRDEYKESVVEMLTKDGGRVSAPGGGDRIDMPSEYTAV